MHQEYIDSVIKEFREKFGWEEILVCQDCHHPKESHWWSGGGDVRYSGYDACHVPQCDCRCLSEKWDIDKLPTDNTAFESFLTQSLQEMEERTREELRGKIDKLTLYGTCKETGNEWAYKAREIDEIFLLSHKKDTGEKDMKGGEKDG